MADGPIVLKKPVIIIDGSDLTNRARTVTIDMSDDEVDLSTFGSNFKKTGKGQADASFMFDFLQDYAAGMTDAVLFPIKEEDSSVVVAVKAFNEPVSANNPQFVLTGKMFGYTPLAGSVGEAVSTEVTFKNDADLGPKRITEPGEEVV